MKIRQGMTSGECVENKWFNMKYIEKYLSVEILLTHECIRLKTQKGPPFGNRPWCLLGYAWLISTDNHARIM